MIQFENWEITAKGSPFPRQFDHLSQTLLVEGKCKQAVIPIE